jgi:CRISPR/Cas system-associated protein Cas5 (RAMP superfamily)
MSIEVTWYPFSIKSLTQARPTLPLPPVTTIISEASL